MDRLVARGKFLFEGERKFRACGVSYGPFAPNSRGERYPEPERAAQDFALIRELGGNVVRTYVPPPPWMFELAAKHELRLMVGMPWPFHMAFLDSRQMSAGIRGTIRDSVT
jgi:O-antigen biosynthesis protein